MKIPSFSRKSFQKILPTVAIAIATTFSVTSAQAGYIISLQQVGPDVVANGTGTLDLTGLDFAGVAGQTGGFINPNEPDIAIGLGTTNIYQEPFGSFFSGPLNFGPGTVFGTLADSASGGPFFIDAMGGQIQVPNGYVSGTPLSLSSATWLGSTFSSLGVTPGIYEWTWGAGGNQNFTLYAGVPVPAVPDSGSTFGLLLVSLLALVGVSRFGSLCVA